MHSSSQRSWIFFILIVLSGITILFSALISGPKTSQIKNIIKIVILCSVMLLSIHMITYTLEWDSWIHMAYNYAIAESGTLPPFLGKELTTPLQHVSIALTSILCGINIRTSTILLFIIAGPSLSIIIYHIASKFTDKRFGIIAFFLFTTATYTIYWYASGVTTSYAFLIYLVLLCILFKYTEIKNTDKKWLWIYLFLFCIIILSLTHMFSALIIAFIIIGIYAGSVIWENRLKTNILYITLCTLIFIVGYWLIQGIIFMVISLMSSSVDAFLNPFYSAEIEVIETYINITPPNDFRLIFTSAWVVITTTVFILFAHMLSKNNGQENENYMSEKQWYLLGGYLACIVFFVGTYVLYFSMVIRISGYILFFYAVALSILFYLVSKRYNHQLSIRGIVTIIMVITIICSVSITQPSINPDSNPWYTETITPNLYTTIEYYGYETTSKLIDPQSSVYTDRSSSPPLFIFYLSNYMKSNVTLAPSTSNYNYVDWTNINLPPDSYLIFRTMELYYTIENTIYRYGKVEDDKKSQYMRLPPYFENSLDNHFCQIYDNDGLNLYYNRKL